MALYKIPVFRSKMEAEAEQYMFRSLIENMKDNTITQML